MSSVPRRRGLIDAGLEEKFPADLIALNIDHRAPCLARAIRRASRTGTTSQSAASRSRPTRVRGTNRRHQAGAQAGISLAAWALHELPDSHGWRPEEGSRFRSRDLSTRTRSARLIPVRGDRPTPRPEQGIRPDRSRENEALLSPEGVRANYEIIVPSVADPC